MYIIFELFSFAWGNINGVLFFDNFTKGKKSGKGKFTLNCLRKSTTSNPF